MAGKRKKRPLTNKQISLLGYIEDYWELRGLAPSLVEMAEFFKISATTARDHVSALEKKGQIVAEEGAWRSWRPKSLVGRELEKRVPVLGTASAGTPIFPYEEALGWISVKTTAPRGELFALIVDGDSMIGAGIMSGDTVVIHRQDFANDGDIVLAMVEEEVTIKRFCKNGDKLCLSPENQKYQPIVKDSDRVKILGKVIEQRRSYE